jgi:hypothetical protein
MTFSYLNEETIIYCKADFEDHAYLIQRSGFHYDGQAE